MFHKILIALDHSRADTALLQSTVELARLTAAEIVLLHVSTGWKAQWQRDLNLSDSEEMQDDRAYLEKVKSDLEKEGFKVSARHGTGKPAEAILDATNQEKCDLIAMASHGHRWLKDLMYGTTITRVRHAAQAPIFLVRSGS